MTYVEFFDKTASENICACLTNTPDRVIFIGDSAKTMKAHIANYTEVFADRGHNIEFLFKTISKSNLGNAVEVLSKIVEEYDDCVFDITGGEEILAVALGIVYSKYSDRNIQIHKFNIRNNAVYDCDKDGTTVYKQIPKLSVEENIRIYGGEVLYGSIDDGNTYKWELTPDFINDVNLIWDICRRNVRYWNMQIGIFEGAECTGKCSEDGLTTVVSIAALEQYLVRHKAKYKIAKGIIAYLVKNGLITFFEETEDTFTVSYKNAQVKKCLTKAGMALEMKVYTTARSITDKDGSLAYNDALNGVVIDWDGEFHDEETEKTYDTENEIDIMLMHDIVPVFISCKNGTVDADELYKLNTMAERFGGKYAKKVLVATAIDTLGEAGLYLRQRIDDMKIHLIDNIQNMDDAGIIKELDNLWQK